MLKSRKKMVSISSLGRRKTVKRMENSKAVVHRCSTKDEFVKLCKILKKTLALESLFNSYRSKVFS